MTVLAARNLIGIYGGSFDPVHSGHVAVADIAYRRLTLTELRFMPCKLPPHKRALHASDHHRLKMLDLALRDTPYVIERSELDSNEVSYTLTSLEQLRMGCGSSGVTNDTILVMIIGFDSFQKIDTWWRWQELLDHAHIAVVMRPGCDSVLNTRVSRLLDAAQGDVSALTQQKSGKIVLLESSASPASSSHVRESYTSGSDDSFAQAESYLHSDVARYIRQHGLYNVAGQR